MGQGKLWSGQLVFASRGWSLACLLLIFFGAIMEALISHPYPRSIPAARILQEFFSRSVLLIICLFLKLFSLGTIILVLFSVTPS